MNTDEAHVLFRGKPAAILIPACNPGSQLPDFIAKLSALTELPVVVVDDGSAEASEAIFAKIETMHGVAVLRHAVNLGKGYALKTGINFILTACKDDPAFLGVVTADADERNLPQDVCDVVGRFQAQPQNLVLGTRKIKGGAPWRNRFGNSLTRLVLRAFVGLNIRDTQTGLRAIPKALLPELLRLQSNRYDFELEMLAVAARQCAIAEQPIQSAYVGGKTSPHFRPIVDSAKIYFVFLRFMLASMMTAILEYIVFSVGFMLLGSLSRSQIVSRTVALFVSFFLSKQFVFHSRTKTVIAFLGFSSLVAGLGFASYFIISLITEHFNVNILVAKFLSEAILYVPNFIIQRYIFSGEKGVEETDWNKYYSNPCKLTRYTRKYTTGKIIGLMRRFGDYSREVSIAELGGGGGGFAEAIIKQLRPTHYHIYDNNEEGLKQLRVLFRSMPNVHIHNEDILDSKTRELYDIVFSVGLIEHFSPEQTAIAINTHIAMARKGGLIIISYPTPTLLYTISRSISELAGAWIFLDERPLRLREVLDAVAGQAGHVFDTILWPLMLTQQVAVFVKNG